MDIREGPLKIVIKPGIEGDIQLETEGLEEYSIP